MFDYGTEWLSADPAKKLGDSQLCARDIQSLILRHWPTRSVLSAAFSVAVDGTKSCCVAPETISQYLSSGFASVSEKLGNLDPTTPRIFFPFGVGIGRLSWSLVEVDNEKRNVKYYHRGSEKALRYMQDALCMVLNRYSQIEGDLTEERRKHLRSYKMLMIDLPTVRGCDTGVQIWRTIYDRARLQVSKEFTSSLYRKQIINDVVYYSLYGYIDHWCNCGDNHKSTDFIACDNEDCQRVWYHLSCVGLTPSTVPSGSWYCYRCCRKWCCKTFKPEAFIECEKCDRWYHLSCAGVSDVTIDSWNCKLCTTRE